MPASTGLQAGSAAAQALAYIVQEMRGAPNSPKTPVLCNCAASNKPEWSPAKGEPAPSQYSTGAGSERRLCPRGCVGATCTASSVCAGWQPARPLLWSRLLGGRRTHRCSYPWLGTPPAERRAEPNVGYRTRLPGAVGDSCQLSGLPVPKELLLAGIFPWVSRLCQLTGRSSSPKPWQTAAAWCSFRGGGCHLLCESSESSPLRGPLAMGRAQRGEQSTSTRLPTASLCQGLQGVQELSPFSLLSSAHSFLLPAHRAAEQCGPQRGCP